MDPETQKKIRIESGTGSKFMKTLISDKMRIPKFLKGKSEFSIHDNPGNVQAILNKIDSENLIFPTNYFHLRKYFWEVDMSRPDHLFGNKEINEADPENL